MTMCNCYICKDSDKWEIAWADSYKSAVVRNVAAQIARKEEEALAFERYKPKYYYAYKFPYIYTDEEKTMESPTPVQTKFWTIYGSVCTWNNTKFQSREAAEKKARELAMRRGIRYYVLEAKCVVTPPSTQPTIEALY